MSILRCRSLSSLALAALVSCGVASAAESAQKSPPATTAAIAESTNAILQGDSARAIHALQSVPAKDYLGEDAGYLQCMLHLHQASQPLHTGQVEDPFVRNVLNDYQDYWWQAMHAPSQRDQLEAKLADALRKRLNAPDARDMDAIEPVLEKQLAEHGYHAQTGLTRPLRELMLWHKQDTRRFTVALPDAPYTVRTELLDDFASRGWTSYGRCERGSAGGWATADAIYAVMPSYPEGIDSEVFRVVLLAHEAQHFADQNAFPGLQPWELEYRAKLVELALAREVSAKRLTFMMTSQGDDTNSPHTYANKHVVADLTARLGRSPDKVDIDTLQRAAREQLLADTARRKAAGRPSATAAH